MRFVLDQSTVSRLVVCFAFAGIGVVGCDSSDMTDIFRAANPSDSSFSNGGAGGIGSTGAGGDGSDGYSGNGLVGGGGSGGGGSGGGGSGGGGGGGDGCDEETPPEPMIATGRCRATNTDNECDGLSDVPNLSGNTIPNGTHGNGYDDDCDGLVDEGCDCSDAGLGATKECYLMPSSWTSDITKKPVGWCLSNSVGTVSCVRRGGSLTSPILVWDGECRGALPPRVDDVCASGDFNCDGVERNPSSGACHCAAAPVSCPVVPLRMNPYPTRSDLTLKDPLNPLIDPDTPFIIDGHDWVRSDLIGASSDWKWELTGGDCDNVLPHPSFRLFASNNASSGGIGVERTDLGPRADQKGLVTSVPSDDQHQVFPAFTLSGDYLLRSWFKVSGEDYQCSVKIQVRSPGLRAELCWHNAGVCDLDLHLARLQSNQSCLHCWNRECGDDCHFADLAPSWGYERSHAKACSGWGDGRGGAIPATTCNNPRLDIENITCGRSVTNPDAGGSGSAAFCRAEIAALDNPRPNERFMIGAYAYTCPETSFPRVNVYCNGVRKFSGGFHPHVAVGQHFPALVNVGTGGTLTGDMWTAAIVRWKGDAVDPCDITSVPSQSPNPDRDGSTSVCVERGSRNSGGTAPTWQFRPDGSFPNTAAQACWH